MLKIGLSVLVSMFVLVGCGNNNEENEAVTLQSNIWENEYCEEVIIVDVNGVEHNAGWNKRTYQFTDDNKIYIGNNMYSDENCMTLVQKFDPKEINGGEILYFDLGEIMNVDGYVQHGIRLTFSDGPISIDAVKNGLSKDAFYAINANRVCFSKSIYAGKLYQYDTYTDSNGNEIVSSYLGFYIDTSTNRTDDIDFEDCLEKIK